VSREKPIHTRKDKRLASLQVVNNAHGAEVTVQFKDGVPPYLAKAKGDRLEIALGTEGHKKVAERRKKSSEAQIYWKQAFEILSGIDKRGLHLSPEDREFLDTLRQKAGLDAG